MVYVMNGSSHSPTAVSGAPSTPSGFSNGPATSSTASLSAQHLPPACGARQLSKLKRFLATLQQFGGDISPEIGARVRTLVLGLVVSAWRAAGGRGRRQRRLTQASSQNATLTIEEFHSKLQEATNFPLRPFVIPFLKMPRSGEPGEWGAPAREPRSGPLHSKLLQTLGQAPHAPAHPALSGRAVPGEGAVAPVTQLGRRLTPAPQANLPLLQRELLHCARLAKQTPAQYLAQHEQLLLDASAASPAESPELLLDVPENGKRRTPDRTKENGCDQDPLPPDHLSKRPCTLSPAQRCSPGHGPPQPTPPPHFRLEDMASAHLLRDAYRHADPRELRERPRQLVVHGSRPEEVVDHRLTEREWAEEWRHLNNLLNCIMDMAEKTRRSLTVLRRCQEADREALNLWSRRCSDSEDPKKGAAPGVRPLGGSGSVGAEGAQLDMPRELLPRALCGYMPEEIWRKAEEAVNEVKRQAMSELQKAVSDAERKAHELISTERAKMERALAEARRQASEDALTVVNQQEDSSEVGPPPPTGRASWRRGQAVASSQETREGTWWNGQGRGRSALNACRAAARPGRHGCGSSQVARQALGGCRERTSAGGSVQPVLTAHSRVQSCWNCGRKASETCSGCNAARYCGSFCQHKDWEKHHHVCGQGLPGPAAPAADVAPGAGPCLPVGTASPCEAGSTGPSRPGSPGPPGPLDAAPR
ncbi:Protein CBFA2T3 [Galemys pyrenaicus]|uniref:Protein CBFA2T3 n=1 Tax=Galemys pyrenaicus TaxID=202257 RepID=A0A8J6DG12_GALPY|nr:Protein CBFA2T3 [Galemys pyrenaicus]